jgi:hypothetical protein
MRLYRKKGAIGCNKLIQIIYTFYYWLTVRHFVLAAPVQEAYATAGEDSWGAAWGF